MELSERFTEAFELAFELHREQARKQGDDADPANAIPYMGHLLGVASIVIDEGGSEDEVIAALLHDGPEDSGGEETLDRIGDRFGQEVKAIVAALSDTFETPKPEWKQRKESYLQHLRDLPDDDLRLKILRVSLADKLHNARSVLLALADPKVGEAVWSRFKGGKEGSIWYYETLAGIFENSELDTPLVGVYRAVVDELSG